MRYGVLAGNSSINTLIYAKFAEIHPDDIAAFVRKFRSEKGMQLFHTLHELTMGAELCSRGLTLRYERSIEGRTPDWSIQDSDGDVAEIFDVAALHQRNLTETDMLRTLSEGQIWSGWISIPPNHLYSKIEQKAGAYTELVSKLKLPYIIGLFGEFTASVDPEEIQHVLFEHHGGVFQHFPTVAALLYCYEENGIHNYTPFINPFARYPSVAVAAASPELGVSPTLMRPPPVNRERASAAIFDHAVLGHPLSFSDLVSRCGARAVPAPNTYRGSAAAVRRWSSLHDDRPRNNSVPSSVPSHSVWVETSSLRAAARGRQRKTHADVDGAGQ